ncbi:CRISPR-associated endonuclease Cas2 [Methanobrevibacter sp.]|uniref:CRISPR-associated endonuclease Cas2 n=1 Tax=Methanobrevibacter sp. TaxID=66852 RepID=UPI00386D7FCA
MRVIVFFDLPTLTSENRREYVRFRKFLIKNGFLMMQESVYTKMALNQTAATSIVESVRKNKPLEGIVQMMTVTEKQYNRMEYVCGEFSSDVLCTDERLVIF